jgi:hypothetical protein
VINLFPGVGWVLSLIFNISLAVPFWIAWTLCGIGETYFFFLPPVYHSIGFWACVGLFMVLSILKWVLLPRFGFNYNESNSK